MRLKSRSMLLIVSLFALSCGDSSDSVTAECSIVGEIRCAMDGSGFHAIQRCTVLEGSSSAYFGANRSLISE